MAKQKSKRDEYFNSMADLMHDFFPTPVKDMQGIILTQKKQEQDRGLISNRLADLMELAANGGDCPKCKTEWELVQVENRYADFHYFDPTCKCYPRCPRCDVSLFREFEQSGFGMVCGCGWGKDKAEDQTA
jgi:hypothetical protein